MFIVFGLASAKMNRLLQTKWQKSVAHLKQLLARARRVSICVDGWSKKGLSSAFLGISACFFDPSANASRHVTLTLTQIHHPHTGEMLATALNNCLTEWELRSDKVMMIVSDNGGNMIKAIRLVGEWNQAEEGNLEEEDNSDNSEIDEMSKAGDNMSIISNEEETDDQTAEDFELELPDAVGYRRMPCMAHTLQLVIKKVYVHYNVVLGHARNIVSRIRKSSVAVQRLLAKCNKSVVADNMTRWNSTYYMVDRLLEIKTSVNEVLSSIMVDSLTVTEWARLEELRNLLQPFTEITDKLQTDSLSLSYVIPSILDLECHLQQNQTARSLCTEMLTDMHRRFTDLLQPFAENFNPLPAAACLVDPSVVAAILSPDMKSLLDASKVFLISEVNYYISN